LQLLILLLDLILEGMNTGNSQIQNNDVEQQLLKNRQLISETYVDQCNQHYDQAFQ